MAFNDLITYEATGADGVTYRVTAGSDTVTRGPGGAPTASERSFDVQAISGRGNYYAASFLFFQYALARHACDHVTAWKGIELGKYNGQTVMFTPPPAPGQSGSLIIARIDDELWGVAILTWRFGTENDANATGGAIPIKLYYKARGVQSAYPTSAPSGKPIPDNAIEVASKARLRVSSTQKEESHGVRPNVEVPGNAHSGAGTVRSLRSCAL